MPLRVVPSYSRLPSKRCPSIGFLSRADREIGVFQQVAPPTKLRIEFPHETGLILSCAGKVGPPCRQSRGIDPPVTIRRGEGAYLPPIFVNEVLLEHNVTHSSSCCSGGVDTSMTCKAIFSDPLQKKKMIIFCSMVQVCACIYSEKN